jgi:hypothetical protein
VTRRRGWPPALSRSRLLPWLACLFLPITAAQAHLLNMTKAQAAIAADGAVTVTLQVDLNRAAGGGAAYHALSRVPDPLADPTTRALLDRLAGAIEILRDGAAASLVVQRAKLPDAPLETFVDPLAWPMTEVVLTGHLPPGDAPVTGRFTAAFRFEEPIALTLTDATTGRSMTRWLVTAQTTPPFRTGAGAGVGAGVSAGAGSAGGATGAAGAQDEGVASFMQFVRFGFLHIVPKGLDHVLFVLGLFLGARSLRSLLLLVTAFTVAHSVTLGLASLGVLRLPGTIVEPLISLSIVWIAAENLRPTLSGARWRPLVVFGFGLLHGMGFASVLAELDAPQGSFLTGLLAFNLGIEGGQLAVIAAAAAVTALLRRHHWYRRRVVIPASIAIGMVATVWTVQRITTGG